MTYKSTHLSDLHIRRSLEECFPKLKDIDLTEDEISKLEEEVKRKKAQISKNKEIMCLILPNNFVIYYTHTTCLLFQPVSPLLKKGRVS